VGCPCLASFDHETLHSADVAAFIGAAGSNLSLNLSVYGLGCNAHADLLCQPPAPPAPGSMCDNVRPLPKVCQPRQRPSWCQNQWCYVDNAHCDVEFKHSMNFPRSSRFFSYASCGFMDSYSGEAVRNSMRGKVVRIAYRPNTGGYIGAYSSGGQDGRWFGPFVDVVHEAAERAGVILNTTEIPQHVKDVAKGVTNSSGYGSADHSDCIYAVGLGYLDVCICSLSITTDRQSLAKFHVVWVEDQLLVVPTTHPESFLDYVTKVRCAHTQLLHL